MFKSLVYLSLALLIVQQIVWILLNARTVIAKGFTRCFIKLKKKLNTHKEPIEGGVLIKDLLRKSYLKLSL